MAELEPTTVKSGEGAEAIVTGGRLDMKEVHLKVLTWNIDGLDEKCTVGRAQAVCHFIRAKKPHVVFLQEVIDSTWAEIVKSLSSIYDCYSGNTKANYYVAILVLKTAVKVMGSLECLEFSTSSMGRNLLQLAIQFAGADIHLMTSHLESTADCGGERKRQLKIAFDIMEKKCNEDSDVSCIFGGDLNLRDREVREVGMPYGMVDTWEGCGSPPEEHYTWDVKLNDNLNWPYPKRPQCRFDRLYLMPELRGGRLRIPPAQGQGDRFALVGKVRLSKCGGMFPSDHWGIWAEYEVLYQ